MFSPESVLFFWQLIFICFVIAFPAAHLIVWLHGRAEKEQKRLDKARSITRYRGIRYIPGGRKQGEN